MELSCPLGSTRRDLQEIFSRKPYNESFIDHACSVKINLLLTEREGRTGEYWPEVVAVRTERSEVRTKTTEGQYSPVRLEQARLVSSLLYGTLFLIVKCTSGGLHLKGFRRDAMRDDASSSDKSKLPRVRKTNLLTVKSSKISLNKTSKTLSNGI